MLAAFASALKTPDLRKKILFTLAMVAVYRLGATIPSPGVSYSAIQVCIDEAGSGNDLFTVLNLFSGGALLRLSVFALGIMPYITASIIVQLLTVVIPRFEQLKKQGQSGQAKLTQYTRYLTIGLGILQSTAFLALAINGQMFPGCSTNDQIIPDQSAFALIVLVLTMTAGTAAIMWMGELITDRGIGNGMSILIFTSIAARIPAEGKNILDNQGPVVFGVVLVHRAGHHRHRGVRRTGPATAAGAVRQTHDRPQDVRRHEHLPAVEGQPGGRHPRHLRHLAAVPAVAAGAAARTRPR